MAFLEIITRCYKRPQMLKVNTASLDVQTCDDWEQVLIVDDVGVGIEGANESLSDYEPHGDYVWILDDDDMCIRDALVSELKVIVEDNAPDVIMMRMDHGERGILPDDGFWGKRPAIAHIGVSAPIVRRDVWLTNAHAWPGGGYSGDFKFIDCVFDGDPIVYWHDVIASKVQRISWGEPE